MLALTSLNIVLKLLSRTIRQEKKVIQIGRDKVRLTLFTEGMILYRENPKEASKKTIRINKCTQNPQVVRYMFNI